MQSHALYIEYHVIRHDLYEEGIQNRNSVKEL